MRIPLGEFEQLIDEKILKRGLTYFESGAIIDFTEISTGEYEAVIVGSEKYTVRLEINNNVMVGHECDCPYDYGPVCKHVAAVIFHLQQGELDLNQPSVSKPKKEKTKSGGRQVSELLKTISHEELVEFVQENSKKDKKFRNYFLASFGHLSQNHSKEFYQKQIHSIFQVEAERDGWISRWDMKHVVSTIEPLLENAENYLVGNSFENVFFISAALLEETTKAFQYADDSNGDLGYLIDSAITLLSKLGDENIPNSLKKEIFEYCIFSFNQKLYEGWDWHLGILKISSNLIEKENEADVVLRCLDTFNGKYEKERAQYFKLSLLKRFKTEQEVEEYINQYISNSSIRTEEIEKAFAKKDFERAVALSKDGIKCDKTDRPGLAMNWYNWLLNAAQAQNNTSKIIEYARFLFIESYNPKQDYYQILKDHVDDKVWHQFLEEIIKEVTPKNTWGYIELVRNIYIREEWWDRLFHMLKQYPSLENIQENEPYLSKDYASELIELYTERITNYIEKYVGRTYYQTACKFLRRMKKLGGHDKVNELIEQFRKQYPQRKALMDELNKI